MKTNLNEITRGLRKVQSSTNRETFTKATESMLESMRVVQEETVKALERALSNQQPAPELDVQALASAIADAVGSKLAEIKPPVINLPSAAKAKKPVAYVLRAERDSRGNLLSATFEPKSK